jgi:hypothetical protein
MSIRMGHAVALSLTTLALVLAPVALSGSAVTIAAFAKDNGNGNGNGGGGGDGGNGGGGGGNGNSAEVSSNGSGGGSGNAFGHSKKSDETSFAAIQVDAPSGKARNLNAELGGLHSLNRNINGMMNSSDPRMDGVREFIVASGELEAATADLADATEARDQAQLAYDALIEELALTGYDDVSPGALQDRLDEIAGVLRDPPDDVTDDEIAALTEEQTLLQGIVDSTEATTLVARQGEVDDLEGKVAALEDATDDASLREALETAANPNREVTDEVFDWASARVDQLVTDSLSSQ